jgi:tetratricopeptide (TPR) repeat protein
VAGLVFKTSEGRRKAPLASSIPVLCRAVLTRIILLASLGAAPPLFDGLGAHHRAVATRSPMARRYFDQGLNWVYAFNHDESIRAFTQATVLDPDCAMCFWGIAYANGPHINNPSVDAEHAKAAWAAIGRAQALPSKGVEHELIAALAQRYAEGATHGDAYAAAMREAWKRHPDDADVGTLFAESLMDLRPWDLWTHDGRPQPGTEELVAVLEHVLETNPDHPGANHFYIHAVEASPHPERALVAAGRISKLMPGAGHMVHMPSHIFVRVGRYADAAESNRQAIRADKAYRAKAGALGFYGMYVAHNFQFLWAADLWAGRSAEAAEAETALLSELRPMQDSMPELMDVVLPAPYYREIRFARWKEILAAPPPPERMPFTAAMRDFARGMALAASGRLEEADAVRAALEREVAALSNQAPAYVNARRPLGELAAAILSSEVLSRRGSVDEAAALLASAAKAEDALKYNEPKDWMLPVRQFLGRILLAAGRPTQAAAAYRADLERNPENGWSLYGLSRALEAQHAPEASGVRARFEKAWAAADVTAD